MQQQPDYAPPAPYEAPDGTPSTKPPISAFAGGTINTARLIAAVGLLLQLALRLGWITPEQHAVVSDPGLLDLGVSAVLEVVSIFMTLAGLAIEFFRRNGGAQPSPIKPLPLLGGK